MELESKAVAVLGSILRFAATALLSAFAIPSLGADFSFAAIIRVGSNGNSSYELGIGPTASAPSSTVSLNTFWANNAPRNFQIGYTQSTNTAYVRVYNPAGSGSQAVTYQPVGGLPASAGRVWTLPAALFSVEAQPDNRSTSISLGNLSVTAGSILQGLSSTTLTAAQNNNAGASAAMTSPVVFRANASGDWLLSGTITFVAVNGGANNYDRLRFDLGVQASDVPEPSTVGTASIGIFLIALGVAKKRQRPANR